MCANILPEQLTYPPLPLSLTHNFSLSPLSLSDTHYLSRSSFSQTNSLLPLSHSLNLSPPPISLLLTHTISLSLSPSSFSLSLSDTHSLLSQFPSLFPFPFSAPFSKSQLNENAVRLFSVISCFNVERYRKILKIRRSVEDRVCVVNTHKVVRSKISKVRQG